MLRDRENAGGKDPRRPYLERTHVPLAEKAKACRVMGPQGIRQISPVRSQEGVPAPPAKAGTRGSQ